MNYFRNVQNVEHAKVLFNYYDKKLNPLTHPRINPHLHNELSNQYTDYLKKYGNEVYNINPTDNHQKTEKRTVSGTQILKQKIVPTPMPSVYQKFFDILPFNSQWIMGVSGLSGHGKSTFLYILCGVLSKYAKVLYANIEENIEGGTIKRKIDETQLYQKFPHAKRRIQFLEDNSYNGMIEELETGKYKYCVIDSVSKLQGRKHSSHALIDLKLRFPKVNFIFVLHYLKFGGTYKGGSELIHEFDVFYEVEDLVVYHIKNRFKTKQTRKFTKLSVIKSKKPKVY